MMLLHLGKHVRSSILKYAVVILLIAVVSACASTTKNKINPTPASTRIVKTTKPSPTPTPTAVTQASVEPPAIKEEPSDPPPIVEENNDVYFKNCTDAKAAGAAPMHIGEPGYRVGLDRDRDGTACDK